MEGTQLIRVQGKAFMKNTFTGKLKSLSKIYDQLLSPGEQAGKRKGCSGGRVTAN